MRLSLSPHPQNSVIARSRLLSSTSLDQPHEGPQSPAKSRRSGRHPHQGSSPPNTADTPAARRMRTGTEKIFNLVSGFLDPLFGKRSAETSPFTPPGSPRSSGLKLFTGSMSPSHPARHMRPPRRNMERESMNVVLPTRSSTASICFLSTIDCESFGVSISARCAPSSSNVSNLSFLRVVAMMWAPASCVLFAYLRPEVYGRRS